MHSRGAGARRVPLAAPEPRTGGWLHVEIAAFLLKCAADSGRLVAAGPDAPTLYELQAELILDVAIGQTLLQATRTQIDLWIHQGENEQARALSAVP